jgi:hypothetical protein
MSTRFLTGLAGIVFLALGLTGLVNPRWVMDFVGYAPSESPLALGEIRGLYGGLFAVMGLFTIVAAAKPGAHRSALLLIGLLWFGVCAGRLAGAYLDGSPGLPGWIAAAFEFLAGVLLTAVSRSAPTAEKKHYDPTFPLAGPTEL